jgi:hypothetical protein
VFREPLVAVLIVVAIGLWLIWDHHPRKGLATIALAFGVATIVRLLLNPRDAGLLVVRNRAVDVLVLGTLGVGIALLAVVQKFPSPGG